MFAGGTVQGHAAAGHVVHAMLTCCCTGRAVVSITHVDCACCCVGLGLAWGGYCNFEMQFLLPSLSIVTAPYQYHPPPRPPPPCRFIFGAVTLVADSILYWRMSSLKGADILS
jgi:hypothetical protein